jgi:hypothetical protein
MSTASGLRGPRGAVVDYGKKQRALFLDDFFSESGNFEELYACGETCTDDGVCNSITMTLDPTSVDNVFFEEACNAGCFPAIHLSACEQYCNVDGASGGQTIVDIAVGNADFSTLVAAVTAAGLVDVISGDGPFTVFGTSVITSASSCLYSDSDQLDLLIFLNENGGDSPDQRSLRRPSRGNRRISPPS